MSGRDNVATLRRSHDALAALVEGLDAAGLDARSGASEWTVADVLGHLGSGAEIGHNTFTTGAADNDAMPAVWAKWNAMSAADKAANFLRFDRRFVEMVEAYDDNELTTRTVTFQFSPTPVPAGDAVAIRLSEHALHSWDAFVAFDPTAGVAAYTIPLLAGSMTLFAGFTGKPIGIQADVAIDTIDPAEHYHLALRADAIALSVDDALSDNRLVLPGEALLRLTAGRLGPAHTPPSVRIEGDVSLDELRQVFPGY